MTNQTTRTPDFMRALKRGEEDAVTALLDAAFGGRDESKLVEALRKSRVVAGEMVMPLRTDAGVQIVGYAALSKLVSPKGWLALAPVAIAPEFQGRGYGKRLVGMIAQWAEMTGQTLIVLGDPKLYTKAGFSPLPEEFDAPYPHTHLMSVGPMKIVGKAKEKRLTYPKAFG